MVSGRWITRRAEPWTALLAGLATALLLPWSAAHAACAGSAKAVYLTFDTGHMGVAPWVAEVLSRHGVAATFFAAHERTQSGDGSLGAAWAGWWKARAGEGHALASHTHDHVYWLADLPARDGQARFRVRASAGPEQGRVREWTAAQYCEELDRASRRLHELTGQPPLPLFRAPGGKTSAALLQAARACGYAHVGWAPAGFLGDELPSERFPNPQLLDQALRGIRAGDILVAHLGIWSRRDPWAPAVLEPLITGLQQRGFCFASLRDHPVYAAWIAQAGPALARRLAAPAGSRP